MKQGKKSKPIEQKRPSIKLDSLLREGRLRTVNPDIGDVWEELHKINKQEEKAFNQKVDKVKARLLKIKNKVPYKSKTKAKKQSKTPRKNTKIQSFFRKKSARFGLALSLIILSTVVVKSIFNKDTSDQLGVNTNAIPQASSGNIDADIPQVESTDFPLVWPNGKSEKDYKVVRVSPFGNDTVYAYIDSLNGQDIKVSQQKLPDSFKTEQDIKLKELADSFQATNVIQIDEQKIYHGFSEKISTQSLIFIKNGLLIFIASPQQNSDETWVGYITGLK